MKHRRLTSALLSKSSITPIKCPYQGCDYYIKNLNKNAFNNHWSRDHRGFPKATFYHLVMQNILQTQPPIKPIPSQPTDQLLSQLHSRDTSFNQQLPTSEQPSAQETEQFEDLNNNSDTNYNQVIEIPIESPRKKRKTRKPTLYKVTKKSKIRNESNPQKCNLCSKICNTKNILATHLCIQHPLCKFCKKIGGSDLTRKRYKNPKALAHHINRCHKTV